MKPHLTTTALILGWITALSQPLLPSTQPKAEAADLSAQDVSGKWTGVAPNSRGEEDRYEMCAAADGSFKGDLQSARGGLVQYAGTHKIDGAKAKFDGKYTAGNRYVLGQNFAWTLGMDGDKFQGLGTMTVEGSRPFTIVFKRLAPACGK